MEKKGFLSIFLIYTVLMFLVSALAVILFFRLFPEQVILVYLFVGAIGLIFGFLSYLPFKDLSDKKRSSK